MADQKKPDGPKHSKAKPIIPRPQKGAKDQTGQGDQNQNQRKQSGDRQDGVNDDKRHDPGLE